MYKGECRVQKELANVCRPVAYEDIETAILYKYRKKESLYVVASRQNDSYFYCKESFLPVVLQVLELFDGNHDLDEINRIILKRFPNIKCDQLIIKLSNSNLVKTINRNEYSSEMARTSSKIKEISISWMKNIPSQVVSLMFYTGVMLFVCSILIVSYLFLFCNVNIEKYVQYMNSNSYTLGAIVSVIFGLIFIIFHEFAHSLTGLHYGILPEKFGISLYLNFIPKYYIKSSGIYLTSRYNRIIFHFAGPACNFVFFAFFSLLGYLFENDILYFIAFANAQMTFLNLIPFSLTDGYFIMSALLKTTNFRLDFTNALCFKKSTQFTIGFGVYFLIAMLYIILMSWYTSFWIVGIINDYADFPYDSDVIAIILAIILLFQVFITSNYKSRKIQKK